jgi:ABC-type branched-subunit amino acid transport system permease subunit
MKGTRIILVARYGTALVLVVLTAVAPFLLSPFNLLQLSSFAAMGLATLGLALAWGYVGILSFGHAAFFGLGAYAYAIAAINLGDSTLAIPLAILLPAAFALLLGHFLFFGRVGDVYLAVITLCVTLILFSFTNSTADPWYRIGAATLGGFNGIDAVPPLNWPGNSDASLSPSDMFRLCFLVLAVTYCLIGQLLRSDTGRILIAIRENELRSELVGYDVRLYKLLAFVVSAAVAGLGGCLFTANNGYVGPTVFDITQASEFLLWVIAGGLGTLAGPLIASFAFQYLQTFLGTNQILNTSLVFGAIVIFFVILVPRGILPTLGDAANGLMSAARVVKARFRAEHLIERRT